ncbi:MAG: glutathione S-transferase N-terminal domain-containing protein [bacterium]|nr:glutathione S-transferase N-terminal domain-containing protein [Alphaproteobacteria bacterium]MDI1365551.1 glutathione S-transferase N-terminal domain-containing protein [bacterium]
MRLLYSALSPFARKVRIVAHENGLTGAITLETASPFTDESLRALNPLSQVPTLILDDGEILFDSAVICDHLDALGGAGLIPASGQDRRRALTLQALADGMGSAAVAVVRERMRPADDQRPELLERQLRAITAGLDLLETQAFTVDRFTIAEIAVAAQLAYFDARKVLDWRVGRPALEAWFEAVARRDSLVVTSVQLA